MFQAKKAVSFKNLLPLRKIFSSRFVAAVLLAAGLGCIAYGAAQGSSGREARCENPPRLAEARLAETGENKKRIVVDIGGAVVSPGIVRLDQESRLGSAVEAAGGLTPNADEYFVSQELNLAEVLVDGQKIYIPTDQERAALVNCQDLIDGYKDSKTASPDNNSSNSSKVSINSATQSELESLEGIGAKRAEEIIQNRPYVSIEELLEKKVITSSIFEKIKNLLST